MKKIILLGLVMILVTPALHKNDVFTKMIMQLFATHRENAEDLFEQFC